MIELMRLSFILLVEFSFVGVEVAACRQAD
jgi:hypothetical protein